jgi:hypothetical protein
MYGSKPKNSLVHNIDSESESEEVRTESVRYASSTSNFVPLYWLFGFKDSKLKRYACCTINIPSILSDKQYGVVVKLECKVSTCGTQLTIPCETMTNAYCLQDASSIEWNMKASSIHGRFGASSTVSSILLH